MWNYSYEWNGEKEDLANTCKHIKRQNRVKQLYDTYAPVLTKLLTSTLYLSLTLTLILTLHVCIPFGEIKPRPTVGSLVQRANGDRSSNIFFAQDIFVEQIFNPKLLWN